MPLVAAWDFLGNVPKLSLAAPARLGGRIAGQASQKLRHARPLVRNQISRSQRRLGNV